jgi:hypothetical protein
MRGYISVDSADEGRVPIRSRTAVYRDPDRGQEIVAESDGNVVALGIADVTVSRWDDAGAPVIIVPREEQIEIENNGNANGITVVSAGSRTEVATGRVESISTDATISIGYRTELQLQIERDARLEQNVVHQGEGDVVLGDFTDQSTTVGDDNVMNRTDIEGGRTGVTADRSDDPTAGAGTEKGPRATDGATHSATEAAAQDPSDTGRCPDCGTETRPSDAYCSGCGRELASEKGDTQHFCQRHQLAYRGDTCPECATE